MVRIILMKIIVYTKTGCPWCDSMRDFLNQNKIIFEEKNVTNNPHFFEEMKLKSGQDKAPTLDIDGKIFADVGVEDVRDFILCL